MGGRRSLDQPDMHAGLGQGVGVSGRAQQVRLDRGAEPVGQATGRDLQHAAHDCRAAGGVFGSDLHTAARGQGASDPGQAIRRRGRVRVQGQVRQIHGQPDVGSRWWQRAGQLDVVLDHRVGGRGVAQALAEQVDANGVSVR